MPSGQGAVNWPVPRMPNAATFLHGIPQGPCHLLTPGTGLLRTACLLFAFRFFYDRHAELRIIFACASNISPASNVYSCGVRAISWKLNGVHREIQRDLGLFDVTNCSLAPLT